MYQSIQACLHCNKYAYNLLQYSMFLYKHTCAYTCRQRIPRPVRPMWLWSSLCDCDVRPLLKRRQNLKKWCTVSACCIFIRFCSLWPDITRTGKQGARNVTLAIYHTTGVILSPPIAGYSSVNKQSNKKNQGIINTAWRLHHYSAHQDVTATDMRNEIEPQNIWEHLQDIVIANVKT